MRSLTYYIGTSLDGFIATPDGSVEVFPVSARILDFMVTEFPETLPREARDQLDVSAPDRRFDTVVMGRATYASLGHRGSSPFPHLRQIVVSSTLVDADPAVEVVREDPVGLVRGLKAQPGNGIWLAGGGRLAGALLPEIDELVIKRYPFVLGAGIPVLAAAEPSPTPFDLVESAELSDRTLVSTYARTRERPSA